MGTVQMLRMIWATCFALWSTVGLARAETLTLADPQRSLGNYEASCQTVTLIKPATPDWSASSKVKVLPFDVAYRGDWHHIGPGSCLLGKDGKREGACGKPKSGVKNGVCLSKDDWHEWGYFIYAMNEMRSE